MPMEWITLISHCLNLIFKQKLYGFNRGVIPAYNCSCTLVLTTLKMAKWVVETCWRLLCYEITFMHSTLFIGLLKKIAPILTMLCFHVRLLYTITLCTSSALTCLLRNVKLLTGYGGSSSNDTVFTICLLIYLFLSEVQRLNLFSWSNKNYFLTKENQHSLHYQHAICCFRLSHYPPPHSHRCY
jgi:hypothetical protein